MPNRMRWCHVLLNPQLAQGVRTGSSNLGSVRLLGLFIAVLWMSGCTAIKPLPIAARAGDSITIALGSQEGMTKTNTTSIDPSEKTRRARVNITKPGTLSSPKTIFVS